MSLYPEQLQYFVEVSLASSPSGSKVRTKSFGDTVVLNNGMVAAGDYTVNKIIRFIEEDFTNYVTTINHVRHEGRFRPFDTPFGNVVVFAGGSTITGDQAVNELIAVLRTLWDINRTRGTKAAPKTGYATAVLN